MRIHNLFLSRKRGNSNLYHNLFFEQKYEKDQNFLSENLHFLVLNFSVYIIGMFS